MPTEIDSLQIKINAEAVKANDAIDRLVHKLDGLTTSLSRINSANLHGLADGVDRLARAVQIMNGVKTSDFTRLAKNLEKIGNINSTSISNAANSIGQISNALGGLSTASANTQPISELANSLSRLGLKGVQNATTNIPKLAVAMNDLLNVLSKSPAISRDVIDMTNALANLAAQGSKAGSAGRSIQKGLNNASQGANQANKSFKTLASTFGRFYANYFLIVRAFKKIGESIMSTADYGEAFNYYTVSFSKIASEWDEDWEKYGDSNAQNYSNSFVTSMNSTLKKLSGVSYDPQTGLLSETGLKNLGLNLQEVTQYAAQLASMMNAVGQSGETTLATTNAFVKLASDISSLYNIDYSSASSNIQSVLMGQSRAGYKFGWDTTIAALQATADRLDLSKPVSEMSQMEKQQLRILTILEQSRVAWGDQANTINSLANQFRLFKNNIAEVGMMLGQLFVPLLETVLPIVNGLTIAIKRLLGNIAAFLGVEMKPQDFKLSLDESREGLEDIADGYDEASKAAKEYKNQLLGFDEVNKLTEPSSASGSGVGGNIDLTLDILKATQEYEKVWNEAYQRMQNEAEEYADAIEDLFSSPLLGVGISSAVLLKATGIGKKIGTALFGGATAGVSVASGGKGLLGALFSNALKIVGAAYGGFSLGNYLYEQITGEDIDMSIFEQLGYLANSSFDEIKDAFIQTFSDIGEHMKTKMNIADTFAQWEDLADSSGKALVLRTNNWLERLGIDVKKTGKSTSDVLRDLAKTMPEEYAVIFLALANKIDATTFESTQEVSSYIETLKQKVGSIDFSSIPNGLRQMFTEMQEMINGFSVFTIEQKLDELRKKIQSTFSYEVEYESLPSKHSVGGITSVLHSQNIAQNDPFAGFKSKLTFKKDGGFVNQGQLFVAREAGAEMVGTIGGRTAVASNDQITQAISQAVYGAMMSALQTTNRGGGNTIIEIDGKRLFEVVQRQANNYSMQTGNPAFMV